MRWLQKLLKSNASGGPYDGTNNISAQKQSPTYDSLKLAQVVVAKNQRLIEILNAQGSPSLDYVLLRPLIIFALCRKKSLNIFDLGGGGGTHFHIARKFIGSDIKLKWAVLETSTMATEAKPISNSELSFFSDYKQAQNFLQNVDLALASSVFQYLDSPIKRLVEFMNLKAEFIFITRTALTNSTLELREIQKSRLKDNGPGQLPAGFEDSEIQYPLTVVNRELFIKTLTTQYDILCEIEEDKAVHKIGDHIINQYGYLCVRK